ncbi:flavin monoamine oxidase family protein [Geminocystis sp. CENA526]|uniref:flavin monoamine oxidase family protein n=1 Tax=Geminocystis sp. CENA526 TaxID=1355871 RepID=UPI003D6E6210
MGISRRFFLGATTAGLTTTVVGSELFTRTNVQAQSSEISGNSSVDVVVIGAGISGLITARELEKQGYTTTILEARPRIGGRCVRQQTIQDWWLDLGGQWMGKTHHLFKSLAQELGIETFDSYYEGKSVLIWNGTKIASPVASDWFNSFLYINYDDIPAPVNDREAALKLHREFQQLVQTVDPERPWLSPQARNLDTQTIESWMRNRTDSELAHHIFKWYSRVGGSGGFEPGDSSILHLAQTQKASPQEETPEQWLLYGAAGQMPQLLANQIKGMIRTSAAAQAVIREGESYQVKASDGTTHNCRSIVVALPPPLRSRIIFEPALPPQASGLFQRSPMGSMYKVFAVYPTAWWREQGFNGMGQGNLPTLELTADSSPPSGKPGVLASFVAGDRAVNFAFQSPRERRQAVLADLVTYWGEQAGQPTDYIEINWGEEPWTTGGFTSYMTPGAWTSFGSAWREPVGRIVWAGTESSPRWAGYYEGAIQSGIDAAKTVNSMLS